MEKSRFQKFLERAREQDAYWIAAATITFTEDLCRLMHEAGITRMELAERLGVSPAYVTKVLRFSIGAAVILVLLTNVPAFAQTTGGGGTIQGTVRDLTDAVIPKAQVTLTHLETNRIIKTETNEEGYFSSPPLNIGKYRLRVESPGMKAWEGELEVETGRIAEVNAKMTLGEMSQTVYITGSIAPLVSTVDPTDQSTLDSMRIKEMPVNGRDINTLISNVTPGVEEISDVNGGVRISGLMVYSTDYVQDGASANNREFGGSMNLQGLDSIAEVRIETSSSSAKYSRPTSVVMTTKGGANQIHGSLYETHRNNAFGVARARQDVYPDGRLFDTPKLIRNEFGGSFSGPLYLPALWRKDKHWWSGRNRTFFFVSHERLALRQGVTRDFYVPTEAMRRGDFSNLTDAQGRKITLYDPQTSRIETINNRQVAVRDPFPNNQIPMDRISPLAKRLFAITPLPSDIASPLITGNLRLVVPTNAFANANSSQTTVRIDHQFSPRNTIFVKVNGGYRPTYFLGTASNNGTPTLNQEANTTYLKMSSIAGAANWNYVFSSRFYVETLVNRTWQMSETVTGNSQRNWSKELGLPNPMGEIGWPNITSTGLTNYNLIEGDNRRALSSIVTNLEQNYNLLRGTHNLQFGVRYHHERQNLLPDQGAISGSVAFNSLATALHSSTLGNATSPSAVPQTGFDLANMFLGIAGSYTVGLKRGYMRVREQNLGLYLQDNWKVNPRLTLTPGIRWDINPAFTEKSFALNSFNVKAHALMFPKPLDFYYQNGTTTARVVELYKAVGVKFASAAELGESPNIFKSNYFDIGPRIGFAYSLFRGNNQMVIRGGYGMYISAVPMRTLLAQFSGLPPFRATFSYNPNSSSQNPDITKTHMLLNKPSVIAGLNSANVIDLNNPSAIGRGVAVRGMDNDQNSVRIHEWNLAIERQLAKTTVFRIRYTGKHGVNTDQLYEINPAPNDYIYYTTTLQPKVTGAYANVFNRVYDQQAYTEVRILQRSGLINSAVWSFEIERRFAKGIGYQFFYTLTNTLRLAGNSFRDDVAGRPEVYLPGTVPTEFKAFNRFMYYDRDIGNVTNPIPKHRFRWNWNYELPMGRRKWLARHASRGVQALIGGWKLSGSGTLYPTWFTIPTGNWGEMSRFEVYGKKYKIIDCRATPATATDPRDERCYPAYLWFNGYISQRYIESRNAAGLRNGVFGLPADYQPAQKPLNPWPKGGLPTDTGSADYDTNVVYVVLNNGNRQRVTYDTGVHPWRNQYRLGPVNWVADVSLLKFININEKLRLRLNLDFFNVFNHQGYNAPGSDGIVSLSNSYISNGFRPRQLQGTVRLEW
jgi:hypothetical protein